MKSNDIRYIVNCCPETGENLAHNIEVENHFENRNIHYLNLEWKDMKKHPRASVSYP